MVVTELRSARLARRFQLPIIFVSAASGVVAAGNLIAPLISDSITTYAAIATGGLAAIAFLSVIIDLPLHRASFAFSAQKPKRIDSIQWGVILLGQGFPMRDRALLVACWLLLTETFVAAFMQHASAAALSGVAFALVAIARNALVMQDFVRDHPAEPLAR
jgi:hypothetical protein